MNNESEAMIFANLIFTMTNFFASNRLQSTEPPYIENVLEKYADIPDIKILALGSSYWTPPSEVVSSTLSNINRLTHRYGAILGDKNLINKLKQKYQNKDICLDGLDFTITCGANQGFFNIALALCDNNQNSSNTILLFYSFLVTSSYFVHCIYLIS